MATASIQPASIHGASTGRQRMLDVQPTGLHMRVPVFLGSKAEVDTAVRYHLGSDAA